MKRGIVAPGKKISRGREVLYGGSEVRPGSLGLTTAEFDALVRTSVIEVKTGETKGGETKGGDPAPKETDSGGEKDGVQ